MNKNKITFDTNNLQNLVRVETDEERLLRLASTAKCAVDPSGILEEAYFETGGEIYEGMDPMQAYLEFKQLLDKVHAGKRTINTQLDKMLKEGDVRLSLSSVKLEESKEVVPISGGTIAGLYNIEEALARDVANILTVHTSCCEKMGKEVGSKVLVSDEIKAADCKSSMMYYVRSRDLRTKFGFVGDSNVRTRDIFFANFSTDLKSNRKSTVMMLIFLMHKFSTTESYHVDQHPYLVKFYQDNKKDFSHYDLGKNEGIDVIPQTFSAVKFKKIKITNIEQLWQTRILIMARLGGSKLSITTGHAWLDLPANTLAVYQEAYDIVNLCLVYGFSCVTLEDGSFTLAKILACTGLSVICPKLSKVKQGVMDERGIFTSTTHDTLYWMGKKETPPCYKDKAIQYDEYQVLDQKNSFCYSYIAPKMSGCLAYPSVRASDGLFIRHNCAKDVGVKFAMEELVTRFSVALMCKSQYIYCRVSFPQIDGMRDYFKASILLPKLQLKAKKIGVYTTLDEFASLTAEEVTSLDAALYNAVQGGAPTPGVFDAFRPKTAVPPVESESTAPKKNSDIKKIFQETIEMDTGDILEDFVLYITKDQVQGDILSFLTKRGVSRNLIISHVVSTWLSDVFSVTDGKLCVEDADSVTEYRGDLEKVVSFREQNDGEDEAPQEDGDLPPADYNLDNVPTEDPASI